MTTILNFSSSQILDFQFLMWAFEHWHYYPMKTNKQKKEDEKEYGNLKSIELMVPRQ